MQVQDLKIVVIMKRTMLIAIIGVSLLLSSFPVFSGDIVLEEMHEKEWEMYDPDDNFIGTVKRIKKRKKLYFKYYSKAGKYLVSIFDSGILRPKGSCSKPRRS